MTEDPEIGAMTSITQALDGLEPQVIERILAWAAARYEVRVQRVEPTRELLGENGSTAQFSDFATLFSQARPATDAERALVGGYWLQVQNGAEDFVSQDVNNQLKDVGEGLTHITAALSALIRRKPAEAMQTRKTGKSRQSRKRYKLTTPGIERVRQMIAAEHAT